MNFDLNEDEEMLKALAERFVTDIYDFENRRSFLAATNGYSQDNWQLLSELGLIGAVFDEADGGLSLDATGTATVFEALGRGLVVEPLIDNIVLAGRLFAATADTVLRESWLTDVVSGERRIALAHSENHSRAGRLWVETAARTNGSATRLSGSKNCVPAGAGADGYIVSARTSGAPDAAEGIALYFVPADATGLRREAWRMADGSSAVSLALDNVEVRPEHHLAGGWAAVEQAEDLANLARAAEALGIMERIFAETLDYLKTREQFGVKLGSFQALQHRMATQYSVLEQCRGLLNLAQISYGTDSFSRNVKGLRAFISPASVTLGQETIQMHGGMGITDELLIGHAHRRLLLLSRWPDTPSVALERYAATR